MQHVTQAGTWCNGEVAYLAWDMAQPCRTAWDSW
jgi:hypothetical protein